MSEAQLTALQDAVKEIKRGDCWCEVGIGNPVFGGRHTAACRRLRALVDPSAQEQPPGAGDLCPICGENDKCRCPETGGYRRSL